MTGFATKETAIEASNLGASRFLEKPFDRAQLAQTIEDARGSNGRAEAELDSKYRELAAIFERLEVAPDDRALLDERERCMSQLRRLQEVEAALATAAFQNHLALRKGQGYAAIEAARRVLHGAKAPPRRAGAPRRPPSPPSRSDIVSATLVEIVFEPGIH